jgi:hypothetical protein
VLLGVNLEGGGILAVKGQPDRVVKAGDGYQVPPETPHSLKNGGQSHVWPSPGSWKRTSPWRLLPRRNRCGPFRLSSRCLGRLPLSLSEAE